MSEMLKSKQGTLRAQTDVPVAVLIAGTAMVAIKCISILLLLGELGLSGLQEFVSTSAQAWDSTLIFLAGIVMLFTRWQPYSAEQIALLIPLSRDIIRRYGIQPVDVVGHSDIAPQRKQDPGPLFPWQTLAEAGIGAWPDKEDVRRYLAGRDPHAPVALAPLLEKLARYGYAIDPQWDERQQTRVLAAFQMHFRPADYRGEPDAESEAIIDALLHKYYGL